MGSAPIYAIPQKEVVAVEHPMVIKNIDNALKTFGRSTSTLAQMLDNKDYDGCLPIYLRPSDPTCAPNLSHNAPTSNVLLKITVPKRTGRKRRKGTQEPFEYHDDSSMRDVGHEHEDQSPELLSHSRLDNPHALQRRLRDCKDSYTIEAVGSVDQTHRFRGLSDYHYSTDNAPFMQKFTNSVMSSNLDKLKEFQLGPDMGVKQNTELVPPPTFTDHAIPFNWGYHQNPTIKIQIDPLTGEKKVYNYSTPSRLGTLYVPCDIEEAPKGPLQPPPNDAVMLSLIKELQVALEERPIWTRRAITNRVSAHPGIYLIKPAIQYVGYQFRGGPWRDAIIKYGVDPRTDPKYRFYQTLFFKIYDEVEKVPGQPWTDIRSEYTRRIQLQNMPLDTHIFDGKKISLDGKVWQVCDCTDPIIQKIASTKNIRTECDQVVDGWYHNGTWAKIKAVMRTKITLIRAGKDAPDEIYKDALAVPDIVNIKTKTNKLTIPVPDLRQYGIDDNPTKLGAKRKRMRVLANKLGRGSRRAAPRRIVPDDYDEEGDEDASFAGTPASYQLPTLRPKRGGNAVLTGAHPGSALGDEEDWGMDDAEGDYDDEEYAGHDDEEDMDDDGEFEDE